MKKWLLFLPAIIMSFIAFSQVPSYVPSSGLVGYWPFNGNANDATSNGHNGIVSGASLTANRFGTSNSAYFFDPNIASEIQITTSRLVNTFSILMWVKPNRAVNQQSVSNACSGAVSVPMANSNQNWAFRPENQGVDVGVGFSIGTNGVYVGEHAENLLVSRMVNNSTFNGFTCIVLVYRTDSCFLYVNGNVVSARPIVCSATTRVMDITSNLGKALYSPNFSGIIDDFGIWNRALTQQEITALYNNCTGVPPTPGSITGLTDICSTIGTSTTSPPVIYSIRKMTTATSYLWTVPTGATIVSGQGDTSISVTFANTYVSGSISVKGVNTCGTSTTARRLSVYKKIASTPGGIAKEFTPSIAAVTNVCGVLSEIYKIRKVNYATSYSWVLNRGTFATITHLNSPGVNDTAIRVTFQAGFTKDTITVKALTACSISNGRTLILNATLAPPAITGIGTVGGNFAVCIGSVISYTAVAGTPTSTQSNISVFKWSRPGNTSIISATPDSSSITVRYDVGFTGGSISVKGESACGYTGSSASVVLQYLPATALRIVSSTGSYNACIGNTITFSALVGAPSSAQAIASVFRWTKPNNTTILSASADSSTIALSFNDGYVGGSLTVKGQTACGAQGVARSQSLTHTGCATGTKSNLYANEHEMQSEGLDVKVYPNPTTTSFNIQVKANMLKTAAPNSPIVVKIRDMQGLVIKSFSVNSNEIMSIGNDLKAGVYILEAVGFDVKKRVIKKTIKVVKF